MLDRYGGMLDIFKEESNRASPREGKAGQGPGRHSSTALEKSLGRPLHLHSGVRTPIPEEAEQGLVIRRVWKGRMPRRAGWTSDGTHRRLGPAQEGSRMFSVTPAPNSRTARGTLTHSAVALGKITN